MRVQRNHRKALALGATTLALYALSRGVAPEPPRASARLVSIEPIADLGDACYREEAGVAPSGQSLSVAFEPPVYAADTLDLTRPPQRTIRDTYPIYSSIAVDPVRDEVVLQDTNLFGIKIFNRLDNTPPRVESTTPKRVIQGSQTRCEYNAGLTIDSRTGDIYSVSMDTEDNVIVFSHAAGGDVAPMRILKTPHRNFASALDEESNELYVTIQYPPKVVVYRKDASGQEKPLRVLEGPRTLLRDPHGLALDLRRRLMIVGSWGNSSDPNVAGSGRVYPPSIAVYPLDANGDAPPLRVIQGPKTQLDWAGSMALDEATGELFVANDVGSSVLIFKETDDGDVAPSRVIQGPKTGLNHPTGLSLDTKHQEVWVSNMGNSSAVVFPLTAEGDVAPLRTIRSAPLGYQSVKFGKPQAVAYDSKRDLYLVPN
ncbi:MAG TPA: hypothetical protein VKT49_20915 [Bryobacteraceae bacterium]|nr:hypothetical protein [Bryobacteraceae bacterium]